MKKIYVKLLLWIVGVHTILWLLFYLMLSTVGIDDQSPTFLLPVILYYLDLPARFLIAPLSNSTNEVIVFLLGTIQWAMIALMLAGTYGILRRKAVPRADAQ